MVKEVQMDKNLLKIGLAKLYNYFNTKKIVDKLAKGSFFNKASIYHISGPFYFKNNYLLKSFNKSMNDIPRLYLFILCL